MEAEQDVAREISQAELNRLLSLSLDERFSAFEKLDLQLTLEHRRELLRSLQAKEAAKRVFPAKTANRLAIWRSRLAYNVASLTAVAVLIVIGGAMFIVANNQTPEGWTEPTNRDIAMTWLLADGRIAGDWVKAGQRYLLYRHQGRKGILRMWIPSTGYAEAHVNF